MLRLPSTKIVPLIVSVFVEAFHDSSPLALLHVYDVAGVRFCVGWLLFMYVSFVASLAAIVATGESNVGGVPLVVEHGKNGPGLAFRYQLSQLTVGGVTPAGTDVSRLSV